MIRPYKGVLPKIAAGCYVDESAQLIGDVTLGENSSVWMNAVLRGDVHYIKIGANCNIQDCSVLHGMLGKYLRRARRLGHRWTLGHVARMRRRRPLPHRHGSRRAQRRAHRTRLHHRGRNADSRRHGDSASLARHGSARQGAPRTHRCGSRQYPDLRARITSGYKEQYTGNRRSAPQ